MLAEVAHRQVLAEVSRKQSGVTCHDGAGVPQRRRRRHRASVERLDQITEEPRPAEAATTDDHAVAAGSAHHRHRVGGLPDVAVAEHRDLGHRGLQLPDCVPIGEACIVLLCGSRVQGDGDDPLIDGDAARLDVGQQRIEQALAELDRHRHTRGRRCRDGLAEDRPQEVRLGGHGCSAALARHLGRGAAEVDVDVIHAVRIAQLADRLAEDHRITAVDLQAPWLLVGGERHHPLGLRVAVHDSCRHHHLVDVDQPGRELTAQGSERRVGDACHRRQHDGRNRTERADLHPHQATSSSAMRARVVEVRGRRSGGGWGGHRCRAQMDRRCRVGASR